MPTFNNFELKQSFLKSVEYIWRYGIFAGTEYRLKVGNFKCCRMRKVFSFPLQNYIIPARLKFSAQMSTFNILELKQCFLKSVEYLWRYGIFAGTVYRLKVGNFKCCRCAKSSPFHCKTIIPAHHEIFRPNAHLQHLRAEAKFSKIGWIPLKIYDFCWYSLQVDSGKFEMLSMRKVLSFPLQNYNTCVSEIFHPNAHLHRLGGEATFSKIELNTFEDIGFLLQQCTGWKWESTNVFDAQSFLLSIAKL